MGEALANEDYDTFDSLLKEARSQALTTGDIQDYLNLLQTAANLIGTFNYRKVQEWTC